MSFLAPGFLNAAIAAALGIVALHFIVTRRPRSLPFPTARFVPDLPATARSRSVRLSDLLLLFVRVLTVLFAGAAFARPVLTPRRERIARVIVADVSGSVAHVAEVRDSVRAQFRQGDAIVVFDTTARRVAEPDSVAPRTASSAAGSLSVGMVAALRAGSAIRSGADSIELVIISPALTSETDRATRSIRSQWAGRGRLIRVMAAARRAPDETVADSESNSPSPRFTVRRNRIDTVGAVVAGDDVVVGQFERRWRYPADSLVNARVIARWVDGEPAAIDRTISQIQAGSCRRSSTIVFDSTGDFLLRPDVARFRSALSAACATPDGSWNPAIAQTIEGSGRLAAAAEFAPPAGVNSPLARWLGIAALLLALVEIAFRRTRATKPAGATP